jgi:hypothetical protein
MVALLLIHICRLFKQWKPKPETGNMVKKSDALIGHVNTLLLQTMEGSFKIRKISEGGKLPKFDIHQRTRYINLSEKTPGYDRRTSYVKLSYERF